MKKNNIDVTLKDNYYTKRDIISISLEKQLPNQEVYKFLDKYLAFSGAEWDVKKFTANIESDLISFSQLDIFLSGLFTKILTASDFNYLQSIILPNGDISDGNEKIASYESDNVERAGTPNDMVIRMTLKMKSKSKAHYYNRNYIVAFATGEILIDSFDKASIPHNFPTYESLMFDYDYKLKYPWSLLNAFTIRSVLQTMRYKYPITGKIVRADNFLLSNEDLFIEYDDEKKLYMTYRLADNPEYYVTMKNIMDDKGMCLKDFPITLEQFIEGLKYFFLHFYFLLVRCDTFFDMTAIDFNNICVTKDNKIKYKDIYGNETVFRVNSEKKMITQINRTLNLSTKY